LVNNDKSLYHMPTEGSLWDLTCKLLGITYPFDCIYVWLPVQTWMRSLNSMVRPQRSSSQSRLTCTKHHNTHPAVVVCQCRICCQDNVLLSKKFHISQSFCSIIHINLQTDIWVNMAAYLVLQKKTKQQLIDTMLSHSWIDRTEMYMYMLDRRYRWPAPL